MGGHVKRKARRMKRGEVWFAENMKERGEAIYWGQVISGFGVSNAKNSQDGVEGVYVPGGSSLEGKGD